MVDLIAYGIRDAAIMAATSKAIRESGELPEQYARKKKITITDPENTVEAMFNLPER